MSEDQHSKPSIASRRGFMQLLASLGLVALPAVPASARTPPSSEGPFYPTRGMRHADTDNDLVKIRSVVEEAGGEVLHLRGRVLDGNGAVLEGARVEIWQCDANGKYLHSGDRRRIEPDPAFQGFGHFVTGPDGAYSFRTIKPVPYTGRTPHIHVKVFHGGREFTTQFYIAGHEQNARDGLFRRLSPQEQEAVSMKLSQGSSGLETMVDIQI